MAFPAFPERVTSSPNHSIFSEGGVTRRSVRKHEGTAVLSTWVAVIGLNNGYSVQLLPGQPGVSSSSLRGDTLIYHLFIGL